MIQSLDRAIKALKTNHPFCSQCGKKMRHKLSGLRGDILIWECSGLFSGYRHDYVNVGYVDVTPKPKFDIKTGLPL